MRLALAYFDPQLIKGDKLQYRKGLSSMKIHHVLVEQSFHSVLQGDEDLQEKTL